MKCLFILALISMDIALKVNPSNILIIVSGLYERCYPVAVARLWCSGGSDSNEFSLMFDFGDLLGCHS